MGYLKKQKERLESMLFPISLVAGAVTGAYLSTKVQDIFLKIAIVSFSTGLSAACFKFIDDAFIRPYYKSKAEKGYGHTPKGWKKYIFNKEGECVDIKQGKDLNIRVYEHDL